LASLSAGTNTLFAFTALEAADIEDRNGDDDERDAVATLTNKSTGVNQPLGAPSGCGFPAMPDPPIVGRALIQMRQGPFKFPAIAFEDDVTAFLENEAAENYCDEN